MKSVEEVCHEIDFQLPYLAVHNGESTALKEGDMICMYPQPKDGTLGFTRPSVVLDRRLFFQRAGLRDDKIYVGAVLQDRRTRNVILSHVVITYRFSVVKIRDDDHAFIYQLLSP